MVDDLDPGAPALEPPAPPAPVVPTDVADLVDTPVDPAQPKLAEPTPPTPPVPPRRSAKPVDLAPGTPWGWYVGLGCLVLGLIIVGYLELRDRLARES